jgi:hypothetical protein
MQDRRVASKPGHDDPTMPIQTGRDGLDFILGQHSAGPDIEKLDGGGQRAGVTNERITERQIQVHRPRPMPRGDRPRPVRQGPPRVRNGALGNTGIGKESHRRTEEAVLIDGLSGSDVAQFGGPIGR